MRTSGEATRQRILEAAKEEFSQRGLAGARINRIAANARASKERLYAYFPSKEALFAAVAELLVSGVTAEADLKGNDLVGYVGTLFDLFVDNPENARLHDWLSLEVSEEAGAEEVLSQLQPKIDAIREGQRAGIVDPTWNPVDLLLLLIDIARIMAVPHALSNSLAKANDPSDAAVRRREAVEAARRLIGPWLAG